MSVDEGVYVSTGLGLLSFTNKTAAAKRAAISTTPATMIPARAPVDRPDFDELEFTGVPPAKVWTV